MNIGWTTVANVEDAERLAREVVMAHLAVCVQVEGAIRSFYRWDDELTSAKEYRLTIKFLAENTERLEAWINEHHPYEIPEWLAISADRVHPAYKKWAEADSELPVSKVKPNKEVLRLSKLGRSYLRKHLYSEAESVFREALELDGRNPYILVGLGDTTRELKKFEESIAYYERVLEFDAVNVFALRGIGDSYRGILQHKRAIPYWMRYLDCNKDDIYVMVRLAESFNKTGNFDKAEAFYLRALEVNPEDKYALLGVGSLYYKVENDEKALACFEKLLSLDSSYVAVLTMVGNIYRRRREFEKAAEYYEKATNLESWNAFALFGLGDCQRGLANLDKAVFWWSKILENEPHNQDLLTRVGDAMLNLDKLDQSLEHYMRSLQVGFDLYALLGMSKLYRTQKNWCEAEKACLQILEKVPGHPRALTELLNVYEGMGREDKMRDIRHQLEELGQGDD
ncbi:MAG: divalent cation tolerance protein CutA [Desulfobulbaceae bacterium]|nr:divalent cation tolerance protein CutA [Desulfobulbaceae bacterium]